MQANLPGLASFFNSSRGNRQSLAAWYKIKQGRQNFTVNHHGKTMNLSLNIGPIVALVAGVLILLIPRLLNYIVAVYLIIIGLIGLFGTGSLRI